jgi:hypothetical protein
MVGLTVFARADLSLALVHCTHRATDKARK